MNRTTFNPAFALIVSISALGTVAQAASVTWTVDSQQSYLQLSMPTQPVTLGGNPSGNAGFRTQGSPVASWTSGRTAPISGTLATELQAGSHVRFLGGQHDLTALNSGSYVPDFNNWNPGSQSFSPIASASGAFGGQISLSQLGVLPVFVADAALFAIRDVAYDLSSGDIPLVGDQFDATQSAFAMSDGTAGLAGNALYQFPSDFGSLADVGITIAGTNAASLGSITVPDPLQPDLLQLTLSISIPISMSLFDGQISTLQGTATGTIVAYALVPEPSAGILLGVGTALFIAWPLRRCAAACFLPPHDPSASD